MGTAPSSVIIVPGLDAPVWPWPFKYLVSLYCWYFDLDTEKDNTWSGLQTYLLHKGFANVAVFDTLRWFSVRKIRDAGKKLARLVESSDTKVTLFCYSLGASVAKSAMQQTRTQEKISRIIFVASPHEEKEIHVSNAIKVVNIYSPDDTYTDFANGMLYGKGYRELKNAQNIKLGGVAHSGFNKPDQYGLYLQVLANE